MNNNNTFNNKDDPTMTSATNHQSPTSNIVNPYISNRRVSPDQASNNAPNNNNNAPNNLQSPSPAMEISNETFDPPHQPNANDDSQFAPADTSSTDNLPSITANTKCHWAIFDIPVGKSIINPIAVLVRFVLDILNMGHTIDPTFSFVPALTCLDDIASIPPLKLLNTTTASPDSLKNDRVQKFLRAKPLVLDPPKTISPKQERPNKLLRLEVNIAATAPINDILEQLNSLLHPHCGSARLHPINHYRHVFAGALLYSSPNVNRIELEQTLLSQHHLSVLIKLENTSKYLQLDSSHPRLKQSKHSTSLRNVLVVYCSPLDELAVQKVLENLYPTASRPSYQYPTHRRMQFLNHSKLPQNIDSLVSLALNQHTFVTQETAWRTNDFLPLTTTVQPPSGPPITIKEVLSLLKVPYTKDTIPTAISARPLIYDSAQGLLDPESTLLFFAKAPNTRAMSTLMNNLDRALDIQFGPGNTILSSILRPPALPYYPRPNLMLQWSPPPEEPPLSTQVSTPTPPSYASAAASNRSGPHNTPGLQQSLNKKRKAGSPRKGSSPDKDASLFFPPPEATSAPHQLFFLQQLSDIPGPEPTNHAIVPAQPTHLTTTPRQSQNTPITIDAAFIKSMFAQQNTVLQTIANGFHAARSEDARRFDSIDRRLEFLEIEAAHHDMHLSPHSPQETDAINDEEMELGEATHHFLSPKT